MDYENYLFRWMLVIITVPILSAFLLFYFDYILKNWNTASRLKKWMIMCPISFLLLCILFFWPKIGP